MRALTLSLAALELGHEILQEWHDWIGNMFVCSSFLCLFFVSWFMGEEQLPVEGKHPRKGKRWKIQLPQTFSKVFERSFTFEKFDFNEIDFNDVEDRIYQYQQLSKFFEVDPDKLSEKYEQVEEEINQLQNFDKEKNKKYKKYQNDLGFFIKEAEKISSLRRKHSINLSKKINF